MRKFLLMLLLFVLSLTTYAQLEVKEGSFKEVPGFVNINPDEDYQTDDNNLPYAVIKVRTENINDKQRHLLDFKGNAGTFIMLEYKDGEVWVYLTAKYADYLKISHPDLSSTEFILPYDLKPKCGYEMVLVNKQYQTNEQYGFITIKTEPYGADVYIDKEKVGVTPYLAEKIRVGQHRIEIQKQGFISYVEIVDIKDGEHNKQFENVKLENNTSLSNNNVATKKPSTKPIKGVFSVSNNKQVYFSSGNLQYQASTNTWRFAEHQWDVIGEANTNISSSYTGWIDLFGWGTSGYNDKHPYMINSKSTDYGDGKHYISGTNYDWGVNNTISNGENKQWRTLTKDEWVYLFEKRYTNSGIRFARAKVNGVSGIILLPDNWNWSNYILNKPNDQFASFYVNVISLADWITKFEVNGAVFLPTAGYRWGSSVYRVGNKGYYWSTTYKGGSGANCVYFGGGQLDGDISLKLRAPRKMGYSVRLVSDK